MKPWPPPTQPTEEVGPDEAIRANILRALVLDDAVLSPRVDVSVYRGMVRLSGKVADLLARERAAEIAQRTPGVVGVDNQLVLEMPHLRDEHLRQDIREGLDASDIPGLTNVNVDVDEGVATLSGVVEAWPNRDLADRVAKKTRGVRGVINKISVAGVGQPDEVIKRVVESRLADVPRLNPDHVKVRVERGVVILMGKVTSPELRAEAQRAAEQSVGVIGVDASGLEVVPQGLTELTPEGRGRTDDDIRQDVLRIYLKDPQVNAFNVQVDVKNGVVLLRGQVANEAARQFAEVLARRVDGVVGVENRLTAAQPIPVDDSFLARQVVEALRQAGIPEEDVDITVQQGRVLVMGQVPSEADKLRVEQVIANVSGVKHVSSGLRVQPRP